MLFKAPVLKAMAEGDVDLAFRCWRKPTVKAGGRRKLKALGLTTSLETGYRLSPRGEALRARRLQHAAAKANPPA